MTNARQPPPVR